MYDCVDIYCDDCETPEFIRFQIVRAKKEHKCGECLEVINPGSKYEYVVGKWNGELEIHKTCLPCMNFRNDIFCSFYIFENIWHDFRENLRDDIPEDEIDAMMPPKLKSKKNE